MSEVPKTGLAPCFFVMSNKSCMIATILAKYRCALYFDVL
ncbi:hypothetical protein ZEAMMB73_Zm00001d032954 [Zea mays]|uniref:Uncharacterized protein n=1 Tax=Zea mays TaxID=4577 RepID=A0A1D6KV18_MAIZE|nr:hypothetical protein ZEAMMB73_Zm00001d031920 [Zea mays]ONM06395.1 hypothetical protein ZEAMMB73_Zm00001d032954 [Zea mays]